MSGHLSMETIAVSTEISRIPDFPADLRRHLLHLLLTHHGKLVHGSPKLPMTPEALMLAYLDDLHSKGEAMQRLIADPQPSGDWTRNNFNVGAAEPTVMSAMQASHAMCGFPPKSEIVRNSGP